MQPLLTIAVLLLVSCGGAYNFNITNFEAFVNPSDASGKSMSICEFLIELPDFTGNTSYCYGSNETVDNTIQQISNVACDRNVTWSLRAANVSGFSLEVLWYFADLTSMYGSYWVDKSRIVKGGSGGQIVEFYVGQHNFTMYNVSEVLGSQGGGTER